jgi:hypothetical protein
MGLGIPRDWGSWIGNSLGTWVVPVLFVLFGAGLVAAITVSDMAAVPKSTWRAAALRLRALRWAARIGVVVVPVGVVAALYWWLRAGRTVRPQRVVGSPGAWTAAGARTLRKGGILLACVGIGSLTSGVLTAFTPDPGKVYITQLGRDIAPRTYIVEHCRNSVAKAGHLDRRAFSGADGRFERWDVTPLPGHVDVMLLDTQTGEVICP